MYHANTPSRASGYFGVAFPWTLFLPTQLGVAAYGEATPKHHLVIGVIQFMQCKSPLALGHISASFVMDGIIQSEPG